MNRLLLDTHTFLWWDSRPEKLSARVLALCQDPAVVLYLSLVSLWEIQILPVHIYTLGMLHHNDPFARLLIAQSISEGLPFASADSQLSPYPASVIW